MQGPVGQQESGGTGTLLESLESDGRSVADAGYADQPWGRRPLEHHGIVARCRVSLGYFL